MKVWNYVFIAISMMLFLTFLGFQTGFTSLFNIIGFHSTTEAVNNSSVLVIENVTTSASGIFHNLFGDGADISGLLLALVAAGGSIIVGLFAKADVENLILLPFITGTLVLFLETFVSIMNFAIGTFPGWATAVVLVVFIPFTVGFVIALAEFFRGTD